MARKTFISYKYSDVVEGKSNNLRDRIIAKLGDASRFYRGENGYSQDLSSRSANYIQTKLKDMPNIEKILRRLNNKDMSSDDIIAGILQIIDAIAFRPENQ